MYLHVKQNDRNVAYENNIKFRHFDPFSQWLHKENSYHKTQRSRDNLST